MTGRAADTARFYDLLDHLEARVGLPAFSPIATAG